MSGIDQAALQASIQRTAESKAALLYTPLGLRGLFPSNKVQVRLRRRQPGETISGLSLDTYETRLNDAATRQPLDQES
jgi:hypothetical protein